MNPGMVKKVGLDGLALLHQLLEPDWSKRISAETALQSSFFEGERDLVVK